MTYLATPQAPLALVHAHTQAAMADLERGSVGNLKDLHVVLKHFPRLSTDVPWPRGGAILRTIHRLACMGGGMGMEWKNGAMVVRT